MVKGTSNLAYFYGSHIDGIVLCETDWLGVGKDIKKILKWAQTLISNLIPIRKCPYKNLFQHTVGEGGQKTLKMCLRNIWMVPQEDDDMPCICTTCGQDFPDRIELNKHIPSSPRCSGISKFLFPCYYCEKIFTRKDNLRDDLRWVLFKNHKQINKQNFFWLVRKLRICFSLIFGTSA